GLRANALGHREVAGYDGEPAPRAGEPPVAVEAAAEELEVVRDDEEASARDENEQPEVACDRDADADRDRTADRGHRERDERPVADARPERPALELVERMRADPEREEERGEREAEDREVEMRREAGADGDVRQVPERARRVE